VPTPRSPACTSVSIAEQKERLAVPKRELDEKRAEYEREKKEKRAGIL
jgi:hypothetical protein